MPAGRPSSFPVGQLLDAVHDADGQLLAALRADIVVDHAFSGGEDDAALAVAVIVVLPLLGEELDRVEELRRVPGPQGVR